MDDINILSIVDNNKNQNFFFQELENKNYKKIQQLLEQNPHEPIWEYLDAKGNKTILHKIGTIYYSHKDNNTPFLNFIDFILSYLKNNLDENKLSEFINKQCSEGCTALHYASFYGNLYFCRLDY